MNKQNDNPKIFITNKSLHYMVFGLSLFFLFSEILMFIQVFDASKDLYWLLLIPTISFLLNLYIKTLLNYKLVVMTDIAITWSLLHLFSLAIILNISWSYSTLFGQIVTGVIILFYSVFIYFDFNIVKNMIIPIKEEFEKSLAKVTPNKNGIYAISESDFMMIEMELGWIKNKNNSHIQAGRMTNKIIFVVLLPFAIFGKLAPLAGILLARHFPGTEFLIAFALFCFSAFIVPYAWVKTIAYLKLKVEQLN